jgi:hypothetical protein
MIWPPDDLAAHRREARCLLAQGRQYVCIIRNRLHGPHDVSKLSPRRPLGSIYVSRPPRDLAQALVRAEFGSDHLAGMSSRLLRVLGVLDGPVPMAFCIDVDLTCIGRRLLDVRGSGLRGQLPTGSRSDRGEGQQSDVSPKSWRHDSSSRCRGLAVGPGRLRLVEFVPSLGRAHAVRARCHTVCSQVSRATIGRPAHSLAGPLRT